MKEEVTGNCIWTLLLRSGVGEDDPRMQELRKSLASKGDADIRSQMDALRA